MSWTKQQTLTLFIAFWMSVLFGAVAGGTAGWLMVQVAQLRPADQTAMRTPEAVVKSMDDATIMAVNSAFPAVVSIAISKEVRSFAQSTGPDIFPFDDFFYFNHPFLQQPVPQQGLPDKDDETEKMVVGGGSGFIMTSDGMILTNRHVVDDPEAEYTVKLADDREFDAKVLAKDPVHDMAVLKIDAHDLPILQLGDSDALRLGQTVIAIGNVFAEYQNTVTKGIVSGINRRVTARDGFGQAEVLEEAIQIDAAINPGNSGGPLLDLSGQVIGINTATSDPSWGQLIGFAIPINQAKRMVESVQKYGRIVRPWLGVRYILITKEIAERNHLEVDHGALIGPGSNSGDLAVIPGSPADKAGLVENDIILEINGEKIRENNSLARSIAERVPGDTITLKIYHKGEVMEVDVILGEFPDETQ